MAKFINRVKGFFQTIPGSALLGFAYAVMLILILMFYAGEGAFIYEGI